MHTISKLLGLLVVGHLALHPNQISKWSECNSTVDGALGTTAVAVVTLTRTGSLPVEVDVSASDTLGDGTGFEVALALGLLEVLVDETLLVDMHPIVDGVDDSLVEELETGLGDPLVFNGLESVTGLASLLSGHHQVIQGLKFGVGGTEDEAVVTVVDGGGDEGGGFRVGTGNGKEISA